MSDIKPIETEYNGYRFRSRLEARWAVFFDALGIKYYYEHEGFDLGDAGWYLPDFWLPELKTWIEIKGNPNEYGSALDKARALSIMTGLPVGVFEGLPGENAGAFFLYDATDSTGGHSGSPFYGAFEAHLYWDFDDDEAAPPGIVLAGHRSDRVFLTGQWEELPRFRNDSTCDETDILEYCRLVTHHEINAAKSARFEHGARGVVV